MKKLYLLLICLILVLCAEAQKSKKQKSIYNKPNKDKDVFLQKQWWIGLKGGINLSKPTVEKQYYVVSPTNYALSRIGKKYENFKEIGSQTAIEITFSFRQISVSFQPTYRHVRFDYTNEFHWVGSEGKEFRMNYTQLQRVDYFDFPFLAKMELGGSILRPYLQAGFYGSRLINANKTVEVRKTDVASGGTNEIEDDPIIVGATDLFAKKHWGLIGGGGFNYMLGNVRLNLDIQYKYGMSNISSTKNRYGSDRLSGVGDSLDDLNLNTVSFTLGCLFPLRFLENSFKSVDKK